MKLQAAIRDGMVILPNLEILVENVEDGTEEVIKVPNLITTSGLNHIRDMLGGLVGRPSHLGVGTNNTAPVAGQTDLLAEVFRQKITRRSDAPLGIKFETFIGTAEANGNDLVEAGIGYAAPQNGSSGDPWTLISRATYTQISKTDSIQLTFNWTYTMSAI